MGGGASLAAGRYEVVSVLGESNCTVYHARDTATGADVAIKAVPRSKQTREAEALRELRHPHIVHLLDERCTASHTLVVQERCAGGELLRSVAKAQAYSELRALGIPQS